jgi:hypothetical protein
VKNRDVIDEIEGQVCWSAWQGYGSVLFFDFGSPQINIHARVTQRGRFAIVEGSWSICVEYASWRISMAGEFLARSSSGQVKIERALRALRGQVFLGAERVRGVHRLDFDLGGRIDVRPFRDEVEWPRATTVMWYARRRGEATTLCLADGTLRFDEPREGGVAQARTAI